MAFQRGAFQLGAFQFAPIPPYSPSGVATLMLDVESGATVTYGWQTDVIEALDGAEQRASVLARPRQRYEFSALLTDAQHRVLLGTMARYAAAAPVFQLALPYEDVTVLGSTSTTITTAGLGYCDWAAEGQRVVAVSPAGARGEAVVQGVVGDVLAVDSDLTTVAVDGARIMPLVPVYLEAEQGFSRHQVNLGRVDLIARAALNEFAGGAVGTGATVTTFDGLPVWDRGVAKRQASQPMMSGVELVDLGGAISSMPSYLQAAWGRDVRSTSHRASERQWLRKFLDTGQGKRGAFLLATGRPDLVAIGDASSGTLTVEGPPVAGAPDYAGSWFPSLAHRRLRIVLADGTAVYRSVIAAAAGSGSQDLALDSPVSGAIRRVELLETVRLASDEVRVTWTGRGYEAELMARVVQQ